MCTARNARRFTCSTLARSLASALFWTGADYERHIKNDDNFDAKYARIAEGGDPQARVKPFIAKAVAEGRWRRVVSLDEFNAACASISIPPCPDTYNGHRLMPNCLYRDALCAHLEANGRRVAGWISKNR